ncbi:hypothetical protein K501DRAFT_223763 [Backusella circina FSU 941]|nr:hypothetical protein K501DRAFT_223763 [Backusella circina FSU 941]
METYRSLEYHCYDNVCHCDWRLTINDCVEAPAARIIYIINIAISGLVSLIGIGLIFNRVVINGHSFLELKSTKGCLRPKPIDCMLLLLTVFNILRLLTSVLLVANVSPDNMIARSFMFEFPWQFGYGAFALYLVGIAQTLADSHKAISSGWLPSPRTVDILGLTIFLTPFIVNNIVALGAGALARTNVYAAEICTRLLYVFWFVHCFGLACAVLFSGSKLVRILNKHLEKFQTSGPRYTSVKTGIFKIRALMGLISVCLFMFAVFLLMFGVLRDKIMASLPGSLALSVIWNYLGPVTTIFVEAAIIFNPKVGENSNLGLKSSNEKTTGVYDTQFSTFASGPETSFQGTLSHNAFDELRQQQMQYQNVFHKHNGKMPGTTLPNTSADMDDSFAMPTVLTSPSGIPMNDIDYSDHNTDDSNLTYTDENEVRNNKLHTRNSSQEELVQL